MLSYIMIGMDKVGAPGSHTAGKGYGIVHKLVGMVGLVPSQGVLHQRVNTLD